MNDRADSASTRPEPELGSVELEHGRVSFARAGHGPAVVMLHQTPRSWDEYRDVLPLLAGRGFLAIALDTPGFGGSARLSGPPSIEAWADALLRALDGLDVGSAVVVGHHTGGVIAVELASREPLRVTGLVLSSTPLTDAAYRARPPEESGVDAAEDADGLRRSRAGFYPRDRPDLLERYVADALRARDLARLGHTAVGAFEMDEKISRLTMPVLLIGADRDPYAYPQLARMRRALPHSEVAVIRGGMVPLPDGWPEEFAGLVAGFAARVARPDSGSAEPGAG